MGWGLVAKVSQNDRLHFKHKNPEKMNVDRNKFRKGILSNTGGHFHIWDFIVLFIRSTKEYSGHLKEIKSLPWAEQRRWVTSKCGTIEGYNADGT